MYQGAQIVLRPFEAEDAEIYHAWINRGDILLQVDRATPVTRQQHQKWYQAITSDPGALIFAVESAGEFVGCVWLYGIDQRHRKAEVRILLGAGQNKGLGADALNTLAEVAFRRLNLHKLFAYVLSVNPRASAAFVKAGFEPEATLRRDRFVDGQYVDVQILARFNPDSPAAV